MIIFLLPTAGFWFNIMQLVLWLGNFVCSIGGLFISLYMIIVHDDFKRNQMQPIDLSDTIQKYTPIEYGCSFAFFFITSLSTSPFWVYLVISPLALFNVSRIIAKDHKLYFMTKGEYQKTWGRMYFQYELKAVYYGVIFAIALTMSILKAVEVIGF